MSVGNSDWVTIALLGKTRGNRGEITALPLSSKPERYESLTEVWLFGTGERYEVDETWFHDGVLIFHFRGVDHIGAAESLVGSEVRVPASERVPLEEGEFFHDDLIGCQVIDRTTGASLGPVTAFDDSGGGNLVVGGSLLIPFARAICVEINPAERRIAVELPEGLKELNRP
ncbi:MAG TPA: ribosome maturation factor RimM [Verrucomicrobiae bacterium]|nr:ribosome maturation factor RimM [Verrucomicrobiae bacterium]